MSQWFSVSDIKINTEELVYLNDLHGYVLPHASTKFTKQILNTTLKFVPTKMCNNIYVIYYPAMESENVIVKGKKYFHEYYVILKILEFIIQYIWKQDIHTIDIIGINVRDTHRNTDNKHSDSPHIRFDKKSIYVVSADFSHYKKMNDILETENCAANSLLFRELNKPKKCIEQIDHVDSFKKLYDTIPNNYMLQWIGRTRSPGKEGVGYLSFLIRHTKITSADGFFITSYDSMMRDRTCLGNVHRWNKKIEKEILTKVIHESKTTSHLTQGKYLKTPVTHYTITYLFKEPGNTNFIRGYHALMTDSLYLPYVFLENTYENGKWIRDTDTEWNHHNNKTFKMDETVMKLLKKSSKYKYTTNTNTTNTPISLFAVKTIHFKL